MAFLTAPELRRAEPHLFDLRHGAIWVGEYLAREVFAACAIILAATSRIKVATGIANIWARDPNTGELVLLNRAEEHAFWAWAVIDLLTTSGIFSRVQSPCASMVL